MRGISRFSLGVFGLLSAVLGLGSAWAQSPSGCQTLEECRETLARVEDRIRELEPQLSPYIQKKGDWALVEVDAYEAEQLCEERGAGLPSIRQIALVLNPRGVYFEKPGNDFPGIQTIYKADGSVDFYYDHQTYVRDTRFDTREHRDPSIRIASLSDSPQGKRSMYYFDVTLGQISVGNKKGYSLIKSNPVYAVRCLGI